MNEGTRLALRAFVDMVDDYLRKTVDNPGDKARIAHVSTELCVALVALDNEQEAGR